MIPCQRHLFDMPDDVHYLNCAYMSPLLNSVVEIGRQAAARKARPWQIRPLDFFETPEIARRLFARLINAAADDIAIVPAASYGIAAAAANLPLSASQKLIVLQDQFPSNVYAWREKAQAAEARVITVKRRGNRSWADAVLAEIDGDTAIVALPQCHWTDGSMVDLPTIAERCRQVGAKLVLDLTQSIGALAFDVQEIRPDFMVAAGYKWMMGPYTLGFLYVAPEYQSGEPLEFNWIARQGSEDFARLVDYQMDFQPGARRFDMGEGAYFGQMPMAVAALEQLHDWGVENTQMSLRAMTEEIAARAGELGLIAGPPEERAGHFLGLRFPDGVPDGLLARLAAEQVHVSIRGDAMRVTPHLYNNEADMDKLIEVLKAAL